MPKKTYKCCFNCSNAMYSTDDDFNKHRLFCGSNYRLPSYPKFEERHCKGFEERLSKYYGELVTKEEALEKMK